MRKSFLMGLCSWIEENHAMNKEPTLEEFKAYCLSVVDVLEDIARDDNIEGIYNQILQSHSKDISTVDFSKVMSLLTHEDEGFQEQGLQLLGALNSKELWDAIFVGASFQPEITHDTMLMTKGMIRALLSNPFYDYSGITSLKITSPFPNDFTCLQALPALERIEIVLQSGDSFDALSPKGLLGVLSLKELHLSVGLQNLDTNSPSYSRSNRFSLSEEWCRELQNIHSIEIITQQPDSYSSDEINFEYRCVDLLPNLENLKVYGCSIDYEHAQFLYVPNLYLKTSGSLTKVLPSESEVIRIAEVRISYSKLWEHMSGISLEGVDRFHVSKVVLIGSTQVQFPNLVIYVPFLFKNHVPKIEIEGHVSWTFEKDIPLTQLLVEPEKVQDFKERVFERCTSIQMSADATKYLDLFEYFQINKVTIHNSNEWGYMATRRSSSFQNPFRHHRLPKTLTHIHLELFSAVCYFHALYEALELPNNVQVITGFNGESGEIFTRSPKVKKVNGKSREEALKLYAVRKEINRKQEIRDKFIRKVKGLFNDRSRKMKVYETLFVHTESGITLVMLQKKLKKDAKHFPKDWQQILVDNEVLEIQAESEKEHRYRRMEQYQY